MFQAITPPDSLYPLQLSLPHDVIDGGKLSSLQLEGVIQAVSITLQTHIMEAFLIVYKLVINAVTKKAVTTVRKQ